MKKLGILFNIDKLDSANYGYIAWEIFWRAVGAESLGEGVRLFEGDTAATLNGKEQVYCLVIQADENTIKEIRSKLEASDEFYSTASQQLFLDSDRVDLEPLPEVGYIEKGQIVGENAFNPRAALAKIKRNTTESPMSEVDAEKQPAAENKNNDEKHESYYELLEKLSADCANKGELITNLKNAEQYINEFKIYVQKLGEIRVISLVVAHSCYEFIGSVYLKYNRFLTNAKKIDQGNQVPANQHAWQIIDSLLLFNFTCNC